MPFICLHDQKVCICFVMNEGIFCRAKWLELCLRCEFELASIALDICFNETVMPGW